MYATIILTDYAKIISSYWFPHLLFLSAADAVFFTSTASKFIAIVSEGETQGQN